MMRDSKQNKLTKKKKKKAEDEDEDDEKITLLFVSCSCVVRLLFQKNFKQKT